MRKIVAVLSLAMLPTFAFAQQTSEAPDDGCCKRVEVIANRSAGLGSLPEYVSVWIEPTSRHWAFHPSFVSEAREAFGVWSDAGAPVIFDFTPDSARATIRVFWKNRFGEPLNGRSTWWVADGHLGRADIEVALAARTVITAELVRAVVMHEIGHLLGFAHSKEPDSIMSFHLHRAELSSRDVARMRQRFALSRP